MTVPDEAVEAALKAWREQWNSRGSNFEYNLRHALEAAAPFIAAQALSDAAEELKGKRLLNKPFHGYYPEWLNKKADTYRSGT